MLYMLYFIYAAFDFLNCKYKIIRGVLIKTTNLSLLFVKKNS